MEKYDEVITSQKPTVEVQNLVVGKLYVDYADTIEIINRKSGIKGVITFDPRGWATNSRVHGSVYDADGVERYTLDGDMQSKVWIENVATKEREIFATSPPRIENGDRQFGWTLCDANLNYKCPEMVGVVAPTDARFRNDMRFWEEGKEDAADEEKIRLEVKQRKARKLRADANVEWKPRYFERAEHPYYKEAVHYRLLGDEYWQRRLARDWSGLPDLWSESPD